MCRTRIVVWPLVAVVVVAVIGARFYIKIQEEKGLHLQVGGSLYPVVEDYFSWSREEPLSGSPVPGEFYTYRRPDPDYSSMPWWQRGWVKLYEMTSGGRLATKQCKGVSADGLLWDTGCDDRLVPTSTIVGHVVEILDSRHKKLSKDATGRFRLRIERHHLPGEYVFMGDPANWAVVTEYNPLRTTGYNSVGKPIGKPLYDCRIIIARLGVVVLKGDIQNERFQLYYPDTGIIVDWVDKDGGLTPRSKVILP